MTLYVVLAVLAAVAFGVFVGALSGRRLHRRSVAYTYQREIHLDGVKPKGRAA